MNDGYVYIHRKIVDWEWYDDINTRALFLHLIFVANWKDRKWRGVSIKRGQRLTSYSKLADETNLSIQQTRTALDNLQSTGEITRESTSQYTIITVKNYDMYQQDNKQDNKQITNEQQTSNTRVTTNNKEKKDKNIDIDISRGKTPEYGNPLVSFVINAFKDEFGYEPATHHGQTPRQTGWNYVQVVMARIKKKKTELTTDEERLRFFEDFTRTYLSWMHSQEWAGNVISLRPMMTHLNKFSYEH